MIDPITSDLGISAAVALPKILEKIYDDALKPGVAEIGKSIGAVLNMGTLWIEYRRDRISETFRSNLEKYRRLLENEKPEDVQPVPPEVGVPILEKLVYVSDEKLSSLYLNLLRRASLKDSEKLAHPSFVHVINSISPDEALLIEEIKPLQEMLYVRIFADDRMVERYKIFLPDVSRFQFPENIASYLDNFCRLGILDDRPTGNLENVDYLKHLHLISWLHWEQKKTPGFTSKYFDQFELGVFERTSFGSLFMRACLESNSLPDGIIQRIEGYDRRPVKYNSYSLDGPRLHIHLNTLDTASEV